MEPGRMAWRAGVCLAAAAWTLPAQSWDPGEVLGKLVDKESNHKLKLGFEFRTRYENREGQGFGSSPDLFTGLTRTRLSMSYKPAGWIKFSGMLQDSRAPWYGENAPNTARDQADLHEAYFELFPDNKKGLGLSAGRAMLNYGDKRLLGTPQWGNLSRTYDHARLYWRSSKARWEFLMVSPVKVRIGEFNRPVLGDRMWGTYNVFPDLVGKNLLEVYLLRRDQNRPGGFTGGARAAGTDKQGVNTAGVRLAGPLGKKWKYVYEGVVQNGKVGPARHRGAATFAGFTRRVMVWGKEVETTAEYKYASGTRNPQDASRVSTFDQLYAANHDVFGHQDLFGWRNIHMVRSQATLPLGRSLALNAMYSSFWLASVRDALYNGAGRQIARSADGSAGRHVGQEADLFGTYKYSHFLLGAGYGHLIRGEFVRRATRGISPVYVYFFHTYSF